MPKKVEDTVPALKGLTAFLGMWNVHIHIEEGLKMDKNNIQISANDIVLTKYKRAEG